MAVAVAVAVGARWLLAMAILMGVPQMLWLRCSGIKWAVLLDGFPWARLQ